jgi:hypothetical protein
MFVTLALLSVLVLHVLRPNILFLFLRVTSIGQPYIKKYFVMVGIIAVNMPHFLKLILLISLLFSKLVKGSLLQDKESVVEEENSGLYIATFAQTVSDNDGKSKVQFH